MENEIKTEETEEVDHEYEVAYELAFQAAEDTFRRTFDTDEAFDDAMDAAMSENGEEPKGAHRATFDKAFNASFEVVCSNLRPAIEMIGHHARTVAEVALGLKPLCECGGEIEPNAHNKHGVN